MLIASNDLKEIKSLKLYMSRKFTTKDLGAAKKILGIRVHRIESMGSYG